MYISTICKVKFHNQIEPKQQCCLDIELTYGSNEYLSNAYKWQFSIHCNGQKQPQCSHQMHTEKIRQLEVGSLVGWTVSEG
jgi:hypothetical protein